MTLSRIMISNQSVPFCQPRPGYLSSPRLSKPSLNRMNRKTWIQGEGRIHSKREKASKRSGQIRKSSFLEALSKYMIKQASMYAKQFRMLLKAGCAPCLAGCKWYGICTTWVGNLLFEVILMVISSVFGPETWRTWFVHQKTLSGGHHF